MHDPMWHPASVQKLDTYAWPTHAKREECGGADLVRQAASHPKPAEPDDAKIVTAVHVSVFNRTAARAGAQGSCRCSASQLGRRATLAGITLHGGDSADVSEG